MNSKVKRIISLAAALMCLPSLCLGAPEDMPPPNGGQQPPQMNVDAAAGGSGISGTNLVLEKIPSIDGQALSLDGEWGFSLCANPAQAEKELFSEPTDRIMLPSAYQLGSPRYSVERYPWAARENMQYPSVPENDNPTGVYTKSFTVPSDWSGKKVYLNIERGGSAVYAYVNGKNVGYGEGSFLEKTFDITDFLVSGENKLTLEVIRYSEASYPENRDGFNLGGIFGSVELRAANMTAPEIEAEYTDGKGVLELSFEGEASLIVDGQKIKLQNGSNTIENIKPWSPESPVLYELEASFGDEMATYRIGFCTISQDDKNYILNGEYYSLKPVRYSAFSPGNGYAPTEEELRRDIALMKECGINTVVTDFLPLSEKFYDLADELGLMVIDCAVSSDFDASRNPAPVIAYAKRMILSHKNHTSVIAWGLGCGENASVRSELEKLDSRSVFFGIDSLSNIYFADEALTAERDKGEYEIVNKANGEKLRFSGEMKTHMGEKVLADGAFELSALGDTGKPFTIELWGAFNSEGSITLADGISLTSVGGQLEFSVGGVSARASAGRGNDGEIRHVGAVFAGNELRLFVDNSFKENVRTKGVSAQVTDVKASGAVRKLNIYDCALTLDELCDGAEERAVLRLEFAKAEKLADSSEKYLGYGGDFGDYPNSGAGVMRGIFTADRRMLPEAAALKEEYTGIRPENEASQKRTAAALSGSLAMQDENGRVTLTGEKFSAVFEYGRLTKYIYNGRELISEPAEKNFVRPKTSDVGGDNYMWHEAEAAVPSSVHAESFGSYADISVEYGLGSGQYAKSFRIYADGTVLVCSELSGSGYELCADIYKVNNATRSEYFGLPEGTYPEALYGAKAVRSENIADKICPYLLPREFGNCEGTEWAAVRSEDGAGILFTGADMSFNALPCSYASLDEARHADELIAESSAYVRIGGAMAPLGKTGEGTVVSAYSFRGLEANEKIELAAAPHELITSVRLSEGEMAVSPLKDVYTAVHTGGEISPVCTEGVSAEVEPIDGGAMITASAKNGEIQKIKMYFLEKTGYISELPAEIKGSARLNEGFGGGLITVMGDRWRGEEDKSFEKGVSIAPNAEVSFDVSAFDAHSVTFTAAQDASAMWSGQGGWEAFGREAKIEFYGDGELIKTVEGVSMRNGSQNISVPLGGIDKLTVKAFGEGNPVLGGGKISADAPVIYASVSDGKAVVTVVNKTDSEIRPLVYTSSDGADRVASVSLAVGAGAVRTVELDVTASDELHVFEASIGDIKPESR